MIDPDLILILVFLTIVVALLLAPPARVRPCGPQSQSADRHSAVFRSSFRLFPMRTGL